MHSGVLENKRFQLALCLVFTLVALVWIGVSKPHFPTVSLFPVNLPYRFPIVGLVAVCWCVYMGWKRVTIIGLAFAPLLFAFNINMLRPDLYFLWLCLLTVCLSKSKQQTYLGLLAILGGMYLWTAIHKIDTDFVRNMSFMFGKRILPASMPESVAKLMAIGIPVWELALAVSCFLPYRKMRMVLGMLLHAGILFFLFKGGWNYTMIAWNTGLLILHALLPAASVKEWIPNKGAWLFPTVLAIVLPAFYFLGLAPIFASWTMYSAQIKPYRLEIDEQTALYPPDYIREFVYRKDGVYSVSIVEWADAETGGAPCMEPIFANKVLRECDQYIRTHKQ